MKIGSERSKVIHSTDIEVVLSDLQEKHRQIYWTTFEGEMYIYKPIGRKDYKEICLDENLDKEDKKDKVVDTCILYPADFDIDDCVAGLATILFKKIIDVSYLDSEESTAGVMEYYRQDMYSLDNQITCIINEAFPQFDIEEIENWDVERTAKYLSRAEWKLQNFRNFQFNEDYFNMGGGTQEAESAPVPEEPRRTEEPKPQEQSKPGKEKLTPEKLRALQQQFPEIEWANDAVAKGGIDAMGDSIDTLAPALRAPK